MNDSPFRPIYDKARFPILAAGFELPCAHLMGCDELLFLAPADLSAARVVTRVEGVEWHLYGDTRWQAPTVWVEFVGYFGPCGILVMNAGIPTDENDPLGWLAKNVPLQQLFPSERSDAAVRERLDMLRHQSTSAEIVAGPTDSTPWFVQSYCIYREQLGVRLVACYTDILNKDGVPLPKYRMASVQPQDINYCRFGLHALFCLNRARISGMDFIAIPQIQPCEPIFRLPGQKIPNWATFHPLRVLRTRPAVRALPTPTLKDGIMQMADYQKVMEVRRLELSAHMLAFERSARAQPTINEDCNSSMAAFIHRANGGAIYVLPDRLVEEFYNTDCNEIRMSDIKLPFPVLFLKFVPPQPLYLADNAPVDGCYIAKQGDEYLFTLTSNWKDVDYARSLSVACLDPTFSLHLPAPNLSLDHPGEDTDISIDTSVELGIKAFLTENAPPDDNLSRTIERPDGTTTFVEDVRARNRQRRVAIFQSQEPVFRVCLNIIVNAICFIAFRPEDISEEWAGEPPTWAIEAINDKSNAHRARDRRRDAHRALASGEYTRIKVCGKNLFAAIPSNDENGHGSSPRAHWRRGHWRRQRHGTGLSMVTPRWIRPTIVMKDNGNLVEARIYETPGLGSSAKES